MAEGHRRRVVVRDRDGVRRRGQGRVRRAGEAELEGLIGLQAEVMRDVHREAVGDDARRKGERARRQRVINRVRRRHVGVGVVHRHGRVRRAPAFHHDGQGHVALAHRDGVGGEGQRAVVIIGDRDRVRAVGDHAVGHAGEPHLQRLVGLLQIVIGQQERDGPAGHPVGEGERAVGRGVVTARQRAQVRRREGDGHVVEDGAGAVHRQRDGVGRLVGREAGHAPRHRRAVVGPDGDRHVAHRAHAGIGYIGKAKDDGFTALGQSVVDDPKVECLADFIRGEGEHAIGCMVVRGGSGGAIRAEKSDTDCRVRGSGAKGGHSDGASVLCDISRGVTEGDGAGVVVREVYQVGSGGDGGIGGIAQAHLECFRGFLQEVIRESESDVVGQNTRRERQ